MADSTILVIGSTGKIGRHVVAGLRDHGATVKAASRRGPVHFDWHDEATWSQAVDGSDAVYLVDSQDADQIPLLRRFGALAAHRGVRSLVYLSARAAESANPALDEREQPVKDAGTEWTILRPSWFNQNFSEAPGFVRQLRAGELRLPAGQGRQPFIDARDIAEVAVAALTQQGHHGRSYDLSGPESIGFTEAVECIARAVGRELRYRAVDPEQFASRPPAGVDAEVAKSYTRLMAEIAAGRTALLSDGVEQALGRQPRRFGDFAAETAPTGVWNG